MASLPALTPDASAALDLFNGLQTQWRTSFGGLVGLDYGILFHPRTEELMGIELNPERFVYLQDLEMEFLRLVREEQKEEAGRTAGGRSKG